MKQKRYYTPDSSEGARETYLRRKLRELANEQKKLKNAEKKAREDYKRLINVGR